ncbi:hypothetical protein AALO_G00036130 [Alosa alosa]|uniref:Integrase zinc-binding domain-containing protein n=1 Tax=Alosa alosa TaxID=278164 RepID=A0AAV6H6X2_9TELE|nr:hypothetical protein AALO_G00036130 [Alosa alosa]
MVSFNDIVFYLSDKKYREGCTESAKRAIKKAAKSYCLQGGTLHYMGRDSLARRVITSEEEKTAILEEVHAGHFVRARMEGKIKQRFYWLNIREDVDNWISTCMSRQQFEKVKTQAPELKPIKPVAPWHMIGVDLIGPLRKSSKGNTFCLTATDFFIKWVEARPIVQRSADATSQALMDIFM